MSAASAATIEMYWDAKADALRPSGGWLSRARRAFTAGEIYHIAQQEPRSHASHAHFFAAVESAWRNLPEVLASRFPSADHLRRYALIRTGWHNSQAVACGSRADALRVAALARSLDEFAVVELPAQGAVVTVLTAQTQSFRMGKADFQRSKDDVLGFLADMIGVTQAELTSNAGRAA